MEEVMPGSPDWYERLAYDMSYFIVFGIMLLNTIVALIVDSFTALRTESEARDLNSETQTFISCIDRKEIEAVAQSSGIAHGFKHHEEQIQNKWDYMSFIFHLREKEVQDYTGPEQTIRQLIEKRDCTWMPIGRSKMIEAVEDSAGKEDILVRLERQTRLLAQTMGAGQEKYQRMTKRVTSMDVGFRERMDSLLDQLRDLRERADLGTAEAMVATPSDHPRGGQDRRMSMVAGRQDGASPRSPRRR